MVANISSSGVHPAFPHDAERRLPWDSSTPVLAKVANRVRARLAAEADAPHDTVAEHSASIPDGG